MRKILFLSVLWFCSIVTTMLQAQSSQFDGFDVDSEYNLWKKANEQVYHPEYSETGFEDKPSYKKDLDGYTLHIPSATVNSPDIIRDSWGDYKHAASIGFSTDLTVTDLKEGDLVDVSCHIKTSRPVERIEMNLISYHHAWGGNPYVHQTFALGDIEECVIFVTEQVVFTGDINHEMYFFVQTLVDDVDVTISDITVILHDYNKTVVPNTEFRNYRTFSDGDMLYEVTCFTLNQGSLKGVSKSGEYLEIPSSFHHFDTDFTVTEISDEALQGLTNVESIVLPASINRIGYNAISRCDSLKEIHVQNPEPPFAICSSFCELDKENCIIYVPVGSAEAYAVADGWKDFLNIVEEGTTPSEYPTCESPDISYSEGILHFSSSTPGAQYYYTIEDTDITSSALKCDGTVPLSAIYTISAYAYADGYQRSATVFATLCWLDTDPILTNPILPTATTVLIKRQGDSIVIEGANNLSHAEFYASSGAYLGSETIVDGRASFDTTEPIVLVHLGEKTVKVSGMR